MPHSTIPQPSQLALLNQRADGISRASIPSRASISKTFAPLVAMGTCADAPWTSRYPDARSGRTMTPRLDCERNEGGSSSASKSLEDGCPYVCDAFCSCHLRSLVCSSSCPSRSFTHTLFFFLNRHYFSLGSPVLQSLQRTSI